MFYQWLREKNNPVKKIKPPEKESITVPTIHPSPELKLETLHRCFECGENVKLVAEEIGYISSAIYTWRRIY